MLKISYSLEGLPRIKQAMEEDKKCSCTSTCLPVLSEIPIPMSCCNYQIPQTRSLLSQSFDGGQCARERKGHFQLQLIPLCQTLLVILISCHGPSASKFEENESGFIALDKLSSLSSCTNGGNDSEKWYEGIQNRSWEQGRNKLTLQGETQRKRSLSPEKEESMRGKNQNKSTLFLFSIRWAERNLNRLCYSVLL